MPHEEYFLGGKANINKHRGSATEEMKQGLQGRGKGKVRYSKEGTLSPSLQVGVMEAICKYRAYSDWKDQHVQSNKAGGSGMMERLTEEQCSRN